MSDHSELLSNISVHSISINIVHGTVCGMINCTESLFVFIRVYYLAVCSGLAVEQNVTQGLKTRRLSLPRY